MAATLRMKVLVGSVKKTVDALGNPNSEEVRMQAVYRDGGVNSQWCAWTPSIDYNFTISNPGAWGKVLPGQFYYLDLIETTKDDPI